MSRSDGNFPSYSKHRLNPDKWPAKYWESSFECIDCGKRWPSEPEFSPSLCCKTSVKFVDEAPSMRWPNAVFEVYQKEFDQFYEDWNEGVTDQELVWNDETITEAVERFINGG